ncbi:response regulator transcription factor [Sporosarcina sp. FSL K6-3457]|uniref:response regulator transcription factor n=1 Tax=Sporosarcina sp. FSL K6-3457 TaxID=2978204 RepID=UPI0030F8536D
MKVLVVDDEGIIRKGVSKLLLNCHKPVSEVMEARNGKIALELIKVNEPDVVITDIRMPVMDGLKLVEQLKKHYADIEIIILTGYADFSYAHKALQFGVSDYLLKPVTQEGINEIIMKVLSKNPAKWTDHLEVEMIRVLEDTVTDLVKIILSENKEELKILLENWFLICLNKGFTLLKVKQLMGHFHLLYKSKILLYQQDFSTDEQTISNASASLAELFDNYYAYMLNQIENISRRRIPSNKRVIDYVIEQIHNDYYHPELNIHTLAEKVNMTTAYLSKMFREVMRVPITQYISEHRLEQTRNRLEWDGDTTISRIAEECGFNDYPYFSKIFKRTYGISPIEYREKFHFGQ